MEAENRAKVAAFSNAEWGKFVDSYGDATNEYNADMAAANAAAKEESGWMQALGTIFFIAAAVVTAGYSIPALGATWGTLAAAGAGAAVGYGAGAVTEHLMEDYEDAAGVLRDKGYDVYKPKASANRALEQTVQLENEIAQGITSLDTYEDQRWTDLGNLMMDRAGSFIMSAGIANFLPSGADKVAAGGSNITESGLNYGGNLT